MHIEAVGMLRGFRIDLLGLFSLARTRVFYSSKCNLKIYTYASIVYIAANICMIENVTGNKESSKKDIQNRNCATK